MSNGPTASSVPRRQVGSNGKIAAIRAANEDRRLLLALTMIAVAALGAYVAYETGASELRGAQFERELAQSHLLALTEHQRLLDLHETNVELRNRAHASETRGQAYLDMARDSGPLNADVLALQAQEEFAASRALQPLIRATRTAFGNEVGGDERSLDRRLARYLARQGIEVDASGGDIWKTLNDKIHAAHYRVKALSLAVLLFVVSLVTITFADLSERVYKTRRWYAAGIVVAVAGLVAVLHADVTMLPRLLVPLAVPLLVFAVIVSRILRKRATSIGTAHHVEPSGIEPLAFPGEPVHAHRGTGQPARRIIRTIALTVLFSTIAGFLYSRTTTEAGEAAHFALGKEIEMHSRSTKRQATILTKLHDLAQLEEERARLVAATQRKQYLWWRSGPEAPDFVTAAELANATARAQFGVMASDTSKPGQPSPRAAVMQLRTDMKHGVGADPAFPQRFVRRMAIEPDDENHRESLALWDTFNRRSLASSEHAAAYLATLTMFAVALCLFGQAFNMTRGLAAQALMLAGKLLVGLGLIQASFTLAATIEPRFGRMLHLLHQSSDVIAAADCKVGESTMAAVTAKEATAAKLYASAHATLSDARTAIDYDAAVRDFSCVVALRPDSALAKLDFATAVERAGLAQSTEGFARAPTKDALLEMQSSMQAAIEDLGRLSGGKDDGRAPALLLGSLGRYTLLLALENKDKNGIVKSVGYLERAKKRGSVAPPADRARILLNLSLALRAAGIDGEADESFKQALALGGARNKRLAARAITDLEILTAQCQGIADDDRCAKLPAVVLSAKQDLVRRAWNDKPGEPDAANGAGQPTIEQPRIDVSADVVRWRGQVRGIGPQDRVAVVWYEFDDDWNAWRALPAVSDAIRPDELKQAAGKGVARSYLKASNFERCLGSGASRRYRAEFYVNGIRVAMPEFVAPAGEFTALRHHELDLALCHPADWKRIAIPAETSSDGSPRIAPLAEVSSDGLLMRALEHDSKPAVLLFRVYAPPGAGADWKTSWPLNQVRRALIERDLLDDRSKLVPFDPRTQDCNKVMEDAPAIYVASTTPQGGRHIGVAIRGAADTGQMCKVLASITSLYQRDPEQPTD